MLGVAFWRSATNLQGHVRAGAEVVLEALAAQSRPRSTTTTTDTLEQVHQLLPGLGALAAVRDRKSTRLNSSHGYISYAVFCLKKKKVSGLHAADRVARLAKKMYRRSPFADTLASVEGLPR